MTSKVPLDVWMQIFQRADYKSLDSCRKTCSSFFEILQEDWFWLERSRFVNCSDVLPPPSWRHASRVGKFPGKEAKLDVSTFKFDYKKMVMSGKGFKKARLFEIQPGIDIEEQSHDGMRSTRDGNGISTEGNNVGCNPDPSVQSCYAFSFEWSTIYVAINFSEWGIDDWILDHVRPLIRVSMKVNHRFDCGSEASLSAELNYHQTQIKNDFYHEHRSDVNEARYKRESRRWEPWTDTDWEDMSIEFDCYPSGLRNMMVMISGTDTQYWAGFYGPKIANVELELIMPTDVILKPLKEDNEKTREDEDDWENLENAYSFRNFKKFRGFG